MRTAAIFIGLCGLALLVAGCNNCASTKYQNCNVGWDFYEGCDLIEGRHERCCQSDPCGVRPCQAGIVMVTNDCVPISGGPSEAVVIEEEIIEEMPMPEEAPLNNGG